jgi:hypothetical protein
MAQPVFGPTAQRVDIASDPFRRAVENGVHLRYGLPGFRLATQDSQHG